ncbi:protein TESPA1 isoform X2 [Strix aluco]|uniref:protein TESPA1 isoform X2 n=1 Tax=Strix aluco TaxID=111821 RepID=UPI003DA45D8E
MEGASVLSPSWWQKRRAWARQSRCWRTTVVEEEVATAMHDGPELQPPHLDDVFLEGSPSSKIETWLRECGSSVEAPPEELGLPGPYGTSALPPGVPRGAEVGAPCVSPNPPPPPHGLCERWGTMGTEVFGDLETRPQLGVSPRLARFCSLAACGSNGTSFEDDLTLGAEALLLVGSDKATGRDKRLSLGHSMASSAPSSLTTKTSSSISEVLEWWQEDAEEILYNLGFVQSEPGAVARVPARFFSAPSRARGIDFQLFLKAQVRRMEMEDPCLMLASRFQQVQALAATADAFFCLYSYVSRTPVQRISPSHLAWACPHIPEIRVAPPQPAVLSPVERLKKAVATMCLYTSPRGEDSPRATSQVSPEPPSQPSALGKVVQEVLERAREDRFRFDPTDVLEGWGRDTGTAKHWQGEEECPPELPSPRVPTCPRPSGEDAPACCGGEREPSPRPPLAGTSAGAAWGRLEPSCPHGRGSGDSPMAGAGDAPCPFGAGRLRAEEHQPDDSNVTLSPTPGPPAPHAGWVWVTPEHPEGLGSEGDSGFGSGSWGPSPRRKAGSHRGDLRDPPASDTPRAGGHWARQSRGRRRGGPLDGLQPPRKGPSPQHPSWQEPVDSFELEELLTHPACRC